MDTTTAPPPVRQLALGDLEREMKQTRRVLERVPDEHWDWKPHQKSMSLGHLAAHVANLPRWQATVLASDFFDVATVPPPDYAAAPKTRDELLRRFDENAAAMQAALDAAGDEALLRTWELRQGEHVITSLSRAAAIRTLGISHIIHHRAQLTVYLRQLDVPVPGLYGPSADESF
ncbi:MAG TPA: DinB family protein [Longimicrobium sp.]|jgi:uncharacterized damage-inducible protein DinB